MKGRETFKFSVLLFVGLFALAALSHLPGVDNYRCPERTTTSTIKTLASCQYDRDCVENAYCFNQQTCLCMEGYLVDRNRTHVQCLRIATVMGDPCTMDVQCRVTFAVQAECRDNRCQCSIGSHFQEGRCYETVRIGHLCLTSHNCYVEGTPSYCVSGYCQCPFLHHSNYDGTRCLKNALLGDRCTEDDECVSRNTRCVEICRCKIDHVFSDDRKRCLKVANAIGELCEEHSQCQAIMPNAHCEQGRCACDMNYHQRGPVCFTDVMLNEACERDSQCVTLTNKNSNSSEVTNVHCANGVCACTPDYTMTEDLLDCIRYTENDAGTRQVGWILLVVLANLYGFPK